ncbi:roadblock/LC7 domain-containing protein [Streptomyces sp. N2-109]|uniref:Roadblock/LC7 domain-containing protein n=1 Tax=Streptomyces gossypii TaxID=2883101 RepID=A0ABT2JV78_9ACTN|nr:roadblock/LC7 domain-containing protein [Streptomyces gossypii]MCT2591795.1 roadblock/LC7 domain-containing protein [Streptomyces gossypii]
MNAPTARDATDSGEVRSLRWLLADLVEEAPGVRSVAVVSSDGVLLISSDPQSDPQSGPEAEPGQDQDGEPGQEPGQDHGQGPRGSSADLATIVSGLASLTAGAASLMEAGEVKQTMVAMEEGSLFVMAISDGSLLGVHAMPDCDMSVIAYQMARFVGRAGHVLSPEIRSELRRSAVDG